MLFCFFHNCYICTTISTKMPATSSPILTVPRHREVFNLFRFVQNPIPILNGYLEQYGPTYRFHMGLVKEGIVTTNPAFIRHILQKNNRNYPKSDIQKGKLGYFVGQGLLTSDGAYWLQQRRLIQPGFHREKLRALTAIMQTVIDEFMEDFDRLEAKGRNFDMYEKMMQLAFRVVARSLFSTSVTEEELAVLSKNVTEIQAFLIRWIRQPFLAPWFQLSGQKQKARRLADESDVLILKFIADRRNNDEQYNDLLDMLLAARYEDTGEGMTDKQLLDESLILFVAGHETTANALAWTWYLLARHPWATERIRAELAALGGKPPDFEDLPRLAYMKQVIEESMRLFPPAWITDRIAAEEDAFEGISIAKGTLMVPYIYGVHHQALLWPNPEQFDPERFAPGCREKLPPFAYMPFGGGPRLCIGNNFAIMEMQLVLATMLRRYDVQLVDNQEVELLPLVTLRPKYGIRMQLKKR